MYINKNPILSIENTSESLALTLDFVKSYLRVDFEEDDELIAKLIKTATSQCEKYINKSLIEKTYIYSLYKIMNDILYLPFGPIKNIIEIKIGFYRNLETSTNIDKFDTILVQSKYIEEDDRFAESDLVEINSWHYVTKINETYIIDDLGQLNKAAVNKVDYKNEQYNLFAKILDKKLGENLKYAVKVRIFKTPICYTNFRSRKRINNIKSFLENTNNGGIQNEKKN